MAMVVEAALPGALESVAAGLPDGFAATGALVVGAHVSDRFVQSHGVVFRLRRGLPLARVDRQAADRPARQRRELP